MVDAIKHYLTKEHATRELREIKRVALFPYVPGNPEDELMPYSFLVGTQGRVVQTLPLTRYARTPGMALVGVYAGDLGGGPTEIQINAVASLCATLHNRVPGHPTLTGLNWPEAAQIEALNKFRTMLDTDLTIKEFAIRTI